MLLRLLWLPEGLVKYFDMTNYEIKDKEVHFYFTELNKVPEEFKPLNSILKDVLQKLMYTIFLFEGRTFFFIQQDADGSMEIQVK